MSFRRLTSYFPMIIGLLLWVVPDLHSEERKGKESAVRGPQEIVVTDRGEWDRLWHRNFGKDAPEMDFDRFSVSFVVLKPSRQKVVFDRLPPGKNPGSKGQNRVETPSKGDRPKPGGEVAR